MFTKETLIQVIIACVLIYVVLKYLAPLLPSPIGTILLLVIGVGIIIWFIRSFF